MKVLVIAEIDGFGGTLSFLLRLLDIHNKNGIESALLIEKKLKTAVAMEKIAATGCKVYFCANRKKPFLNPYLTFFYDFTAYYSAFRDFRPDLIVASNGTPGQMAGVLFFPIPVLFVMHSYAGTKFMLPVRLLWKFAEKLRNSFVTVSRFAAKEIASALGVQSESIHVLYNSFKPVQSSSFNKSPIVLTLGHVEWYKNPDVWLKVAQDVIARHPDVKFVWLGAGRMLEQMQDKVQTLGLSGRIALPGYCDDVGRFYGEAQVYFQPSLIESHGIAVVDAMAHGLPCVSSNVGGLPESVLDGDTGFTCSPNDVRGFADRITTLLGDHSLRDRMGNVGRRRAEALFTETIQERKILDFYQQMKN